MPDLCIVNNPSTAETPEPAASPPLARVLDDLEFAIAAFDCAVEDLANEADERAADDDLPADIRAAAEDISHAASTAMANVSACFCGLRNAVMDADESVGGRS